ncbi:hypothetical protein WJX84_011736, partial [Apatococcus fuscideae]
MMLSEACVSKFEHLSAASSIPSGQRAFCPQPDCGQLHFYDDSGCGLNAVARLSDEVACTACHHTFCKQCGSPWYTGHECLSNAMLDATSKLCPAGCGARMTHYRGHGCHHLRCRTCSHRFCFNCLGPYRPSEKSVCSCPVFCSSACGCPTCPDCLPGRPCTYSDGLTIYEPTSQTEHVSFVPAESERPTFMATEFVRRPRIQLQNPGNWGEVAEPPTPWHPLAELLEQFEGDLWPNRQEQVMLRLFTSRTGLTCPCPTWRQTLAATQLQPCWLQSRPSAAKLCSRTRHFLSNFLIRDFRIGIFLENAGLLNNPAYMDDSDEDDEDTATVVAKYRRHVLAMAAELVLALLQQLVCHQLYTQQELQPSMTAAACAVHELPICAALNFDHEGLLPGPINVLKALFYDHTCDGSLTGHGSIR